ncbi:MAG TPA: dihydrodipicolinate reductase C-terminal domain-containing protein [Candidatus Paceibacterota bacterium]|nr:dihydrodipicolinate reductase C-terminal domain-containing protein [Candidatus Paceibacterota bacterium]
MKNTVIVSGLPGNMATLIAQEVGTSEHLSLFDVGLTGLDQPSCFQLGEDGKSITLYSPKEREDYFLPYLRVQSLNEFNPIVVDFTHPDAVLENVQFYCRNNLPFVMGTTGGDRDQLEKIVRDSSVPAVIAPNMAMQVVALQAGIAYMAETFPNAFSGFRLGVEESHQVNKVDTSGTAKAIVSSFNQLGVNFAVGDIEKIRDNSRQVRMGVPVEHLGGHGWHWYFLDNPEETMHFEFVHNINGRHPYVVGTIKAIEFLFKRIAEGCKGQVFSMIDVLKAG